MPIPLITAKPVETEPLRDDIRALKNFVRQFREDDEEEYETEFERTSRETGIPMQGPI
jgi:hypothetical protein